MSPAIRHVLYQDFACLSALLFCYRDHSGNTALHQAYKHYHTETVQLLLASGADDHALNGKAAFPVFGLATCLHSFSIAEEKLALTARNQHGQTLLLSMLSSLPDQPSCVILDNISGFLSQLCTLQKGKAYFMANDDRGQNALLLIATSTPVASHCNCPWPQGIDLNVTDREGCTPILLAAQHGNLSFIKRILSLGNVLTHPGTQQSILHTMAACPTSAQPQHSFTAAKIVQTLVKAGARCVYAQQHLL